MQPLHSLEAERAFKKTCSQKYELFSLNRQLVCQVAKTLPRNRRIKAMTYLLYEYGRQEAIPTGELVDKLFALDAVYKVGGVVVGVDVTLDPALILEKQQKLSALAEAHRALGIEKTVVFCPEIHKDLASIL